MNIPALILSLMLRIKSSLKMALQAIVTLSMVLPIPLRAAPREIQRDVSSLAVLMQLDSGYRKCGPAYVNMHHITGPDKRWEQCVLGYRGKVDFCAYGNIQQDFVIDTVFRNPSLMQSRLELYNIATHRCKRIINVLGVSDKAIVWTCNEESSILLSYLFNARDALQRERDLAFRKTYKESSEWDLAIIDCARRSTETSGNVSNLLRSSYASEAQRSVLLSLSMLPNEVTIEFVRDFTKKLESSDE